MKVKAVRRETDKKRVKEKQRKERQRQGEKQNKDLTKTLHIKINNNTIPVYLFSFPSRFPLSLFVNIIAFLFPIFVSQSFAFSLHPLSLSLTPPFPPFSICFSPLLFLSFPFFYFFFIHFPVLSPSLISNSLLYTLICFNSAFFLIIR